jgi:hypothetical protein
MTPTPRTDAFILSGITKTEWNWRNLARQLERENAELLEALELLSIHGHADDCLLLNRANQTCDCGLDNAYLVIAKTKGKP